MRLASFARRLSTKGSSIVGQLMLCGVLVLATKVAGWATENGASVYPVGVETVMSGMTPGPGGTILCEFSTYYFANQMMNGHGRNIVPEFRLRVVANALKVEHAWRTGVWGGTLKSNVGMPLIYQQLRTPSGNFSGFGVGNVAISPLGVGYHKERLHWFYEGDVWLAGPAYSKSKVLNIGQHNYAAGPAGGFTYLADQQRFEISMRVQYVVNFRNGDTGYRSGNEFMQEYAVLRALSKRINLGVNGYYYQQITNDRLHGAPVNGDGNRGRNFAIGPQVRIRLGQTAGLALKYERDTLVENKPRGDAIWLQIGLPFGGGHGN